ncbi:hypothetical protein FHS81_001011 [Pseudochelatococcus contaminans]|uniref:Uncharacterized protein n=1 Tax=Pseudochelatococcus contaminans TaxID=1538103 RepID=A0A7W6EFR6_9HYPH|nr:hypothetical protein [Pseudochelatococcus contaminans]
MLRSAMAERLAAAVIVSILLWCIAFWAMGWL